MAKAVSEISSGQQFSRSLDAGAIADSQSRVFRVVLNTPGEVIDIQSACSVYIGDRHPTNTNIYCSSFDARFEGESRMVILCTFNYTSSANSQASSDDPRGQVPGARPANWTTSTSLIEQPVYQWRRRSRLKPPLPNAGQLGWGDFSPATNAAGDHYDAITQLTGMVTIRISQEEVAIDPLRHMDYVGYVNSETIELGSLKMEPHTVMFRGVQAQSFVESWRGEAYRGWKADYEFAFKRNKTWIWTGAAEEEVALGWDIAVPESGFNVIARNIAGAPADVEIYGQPLRHTDGRIVPPLLLPDNVVAGDKVRAMVKVFEYEQGGVSQAPSASPVPLNDDGSPRKHTANPRVLVKGYAVQPEINLTQTLGLRIL